MVGGQREQHVAGLVSDVEGQLQRHVRAGNVGVEARAFAHRLETAQDDVAALPHANQANVVACQVRRQVSGVSRDDRGPAGRQRVHELGLCLGDPRKRAELLEVNRRDRRDHADVWPRQGCELGDLAQAPHGELQDAHLGIRFEPRERQRHADLVVVAPLGRDHSRVRAHERGEDVLRRGLAHRAGDAHEPGAAPVADEPADRLERAERVLRDEHGRGTALARVVDVPPAVADDDEEVAGRDPARVDLDAGDVDRAQPLQLSEAERLDRVELERDHAAAPMRRSASRATSRSSHGKVSPPM